MNQACKFTIWSILFVDKQYFLLFKKSMDYLGGLKS